MLGGLLLLSTWWFTAGSAQALSYPPSIGCAVWGSAPAGAGVLRVQGMGFLAGSRVQLTVAGQRTGGAVADQAGSFEASWPVGDLAAGATVTAADATCTTTGPLSIENQLGPSEESALPPVAPGDGSAGGQPNPVGPAKPPMKRPTPGPAASATNPEPVPPAPQAAPTAVAIPSIPLTGLPPQLFLGLAGAVLLAGAALTGLTGRLGHRGERRPTAASSVASTLPSAPSNALT